MQGNSNPRLAERVVLITGGTEGIGAECAAEWLRRGAEVVVVGLSNGPSGPSGTTTLHGDISQAEFRSHMLQTVLSKHGRLDVLVNNAGVGLYRPASLSEDDDVRRIFEVNVFAPLALARDFLPTLRKSNVGVIVNVGSVGAWASLPWSPVYCASKSALQSLSEGMYREFSSYGIHVVTVAPGIVATGFREHVIKGQVPPGVRSIRGIVKPEALAKAIVDGAENRRRWVIKPWTVIPFAVLNALMPGIIDWYCRSRWNFREDEIAQNV